MLPVQRPACAVPHRKIMYQLALNSEKGYLAVKMSIRHHWFFIVSSVCVAGLNYAFYLVISRFLELNEFGDAQLLTSVLTQINIVLSALTLVVINTLNHSTKQHQKLLTRILDSYFLRAGAVLAIAMLLVAPIAVDRLQLESPYPYIALCATVPLSFAFTMRIGYLRAHRLFNETSWAQLIVSGGKIVFAIGLLAASTRTFGALASIFLAQAMALLYVQNSRSVTSADMPLFGPLLNRAGSQQKIASAKSLLERQKQHIATVIIGSLSLSLLFGSDIIIAKIVYSPDVAGSYTAIAIIARLIFFLSLPIAAILFSYLSADTPWRSVVGRITRSLRASIALTSICVAVLYMGPEFIIDVLLGPEYAQQADLLPRLSLAVFLLSIVNILIMALLAIRFVYTRYVSLLFAALYIACLIRADDTLDSFVNAQLRAATLLLALSIIIFVLLHFKKRTYMEEGG